MMALMFSYLLYSIFETQTLDPTDGERHVDDDDIYDGNTRFDVFQSIMRWFSSRRFSSTRTIDLKISL